MPNFPLWVSLLCQWQQEDSDRTDTGWARSNSSFLFPAYSSSASKTGFPLLEAPKIAYDIQLMNETPVEQEVVLTMDIEFISTLSPDFRPIDAVWLDVTGVCGSSDVNVTSPVMHLTALAVTQLDFAGKIITAGGHLHDGLLQFTFEERTNVSRRYPV